MEKLTLVIGNKNYSSWSLRAWLLLKQSSLLFKEIRIPLHVPGSIEQIEHYSPSGKVPLLIDGKIKIWESLAIAEYLAEKFPKANLWPRNQETKALARAISSEMHAGFIYLRKAMPMNCRAHPSPSRLGRSPVLGAARRQGRAHPKREPMDPRVQGDIGRICDIWRECRKRFGKGGEMLFGKFSIADAMYAPVVFRFNTYGVELDSVCRQYFDTVLALPAMQEWLEAAKKEKETIPETDAVRQK